MNPGIFDRVAGTLANASLIDSTDNETGFGGCFRVVASPNKLRKIITTYGESISEMKKYGVSIPKKDSPR
jgi:hypothetical protein